MSDILLTYENNRGRITVIGSLWFGVVYFQLAHKLIDDAPDMVHFMLDHPSWRPNAILALHKMVIEGQTNIKAKEIALKVMEHPEIFGIENWIVVASRRLRILNQLLDLENSLDDAIRQWANDPATEMEVYYYEGRKLTYQQAQKIRSQPRFNPKSLKNIDVETSRERREWKRVSRAVTNRRTLMNQVNEARLKFRDAQLMRGSGGKENVAIIDFGSNLWPPYDDVSRIQPLLLRTLQYDQIAKTYLDKLIIRINHVEVEIIVPQP